MKFGVTPNGGVRAGTGLLLFMMLVISTVRRGCQMSRADTCMEGLKKVISVASSTIFQGCKLVHMYQFEGTAVRDRPASKIRDQIDAFCQVYSQSSP